MCTTQKDNLVLFKDMCLGSCALKILLCRTQLGPAIYTAKVVLDNKNIHSESVYCTWSAQAMPPNNLCICPLVTKLVLFGLFLF